MGVDSQPDRKTNGGSSLVLLFQGCVFSKILNRVELRGEANK